MARANPGVYDPKTGAGLGNDPWNQRRTWLICLGLALLVLAAYGQLWDCEFVAFDDGGYVTANDMVRGGVSWEGVVWAFSSFYGSNWHPLTWISHMLDVQLYGMNASGHHLTSLLLHLANSILLFLLLRRLTRAEGPCALVAALFALHPLHVESVAWIAERKDVLSAFFWILTVWAYTRYVEESRSKGSRRKTWYAASLLLFALGLMAKPMLVTLPFVLLLLDYWPLRRLDPPVLRLMMEKIPFFALAAASSVMAFLAQRLGGSVAPLAALTLGPRLANALVSYARYMGKTLWPVDLAVLYPLPPHWPDWEVGCAGLLLALVTFWAVWRIRSRPYLAVGWFWFLGMLVPVIGLVQIGHQSMADRYDYLPGLGLFIMLVWAAWEWLAPRTPRAGAVLGCLAVVGCLAATRTQVGYWRTSETLFRHAVQCTEGNGFMESALGIILVQEGNKEEGMAHLRRSVELDPDIDQVHAALGEALRLLGHWPQAVEQFQIAAALAPNDPRDQYELGTALLQNGQAEDAIPHFRKSLQNLPESAKARCQLANALMQTGRTKDAIGEYERVLQTQPDYLAAEANLAWILATNPDSA
ncbi:MAG: tetratricopeptide repeat protein, partial [Verrucomicrobiota bacterium]